MTLSAATAILEDFYDQSNDDLLTALAYIGSYKKHLTDEQRQQVHDDCCRMTWADRFLLDTPHGKDNPGQTACELRGRLWKPELSMVTFDFALNFYLKRHDIR